MATIGTIRESGSSRRVIITLPAHVPVPAQTAIVVWQTAPCRAGRGLRVIRAVVIVYALLPHRFAVVLLFPVRHHVQEQVWVPRCGFRYLFN